MICGHRHKKLKYPNPQDLKDLDGSHDDGIPISFPELRSPWPAVGKRELWEQPFQACAIDADAQWAG